MAANTHLEKKLLGSLCELYNGYAFKPSDWKSIGKPIIRIQNLNGGQVFNYYKGGLTERYSVAPETLLFAWSGNRGTSFGPYVWDGPDGFLNQHIFKVVPNEEVDKGWLYYALDRVREQVERNAHGASGLVHVRKEDLCKYVMLVPTDKAEQRTLATILDTIDDTIRHTEAIIAKLQRIKAGLVHDLLTRGLDENGELRDPIRHPEQFHDTPLGRLPIDWKATTIDEIANHVGSGVTPTGGSTVYTTEGVLFIRSQNVTFEGLLLDDVAYIPHRTHLQMGRSELKDYDVLLNITGASIGRCCVYPGAEVPANVNQHVCAIRLPQPNPGKSYYLAEYLSSPSGQNQIFRFNAGSNREGLNYQQIRSMFIPWPKKTEEAEQISDILRGINCQVTEERRILLKHRKLKEGLMRDLLTGKVPVTTLIGATNA